MICRNSSGIGILAVCAVVLTAQAAFAGFSPHPWERMTNEVFSVELAGVDALHLSYQGDPAPVLVIGNLRSDDLRGSGEVRISSFGGHSTRFPVGVELAAGGAKRVPLGARLDKGIWRVSVELDVGGRRIASETRFALVKRRTVTPRLGDDAFRIGFNYHMERYTDADNDKCLAALVQAGAKMVRVGMGLAFCQVEPKEGEFHWEKCDARMDLLERNGLAVDAILDGTPVWARDERHKDIEWSTYGAASVPARSGLYREYCRRAAERYGRRIAWYELGNEWDFIKPSVLTVEEAIGIQKEGFEGVKAGCAEAKVLSNGWASPHSYCGHPDWIHVGLQERLMTEAKDFYDAHPVHLHGPYQEYRRRIGQFHRWRREKGIGDKPWFSNETSLSCAGPGEDAVAECVWQKILFAWTHGSVDYIWYNLRSIGLAAMDSEGGYGVMTGDFYPRTTYPAFAGLTSCFEGLKPRAIVHEGASREMYRFEGVCGGRRIVAFPAWDVWAKEPVSVTVRTDARRAWVADLFDNRRETPVVDGRVAFAFGKTPCALILEDATSAEPDADDLRRNESTGVERITLGEQGYEFRLDGFECVHENFKADPRHLDRVWWGKGDCSGTVRVERTVDGRLSVRARTTDEKVAPGDRMAIFEDGVEHAVPATVVKAGEGVCATSELAFDAVIAFPDETRTLEIRIEDDDGQGVDGWITTGPFSIEKKGTKGK